MNLSTNIAVTALVLLVVSGGLLYPIHSSISELEATVEQLEAEGNQGADLSSMLRTADEQIEQLRQEVAAQDITLCPDTPEARHQFENALHSQVQSAGLNRISMDRQEGFGTGTVPSFVIALVVEGDAFQLHNFLRGLESLEWVTRLLKLEVQPGDSQRRIKMQIAVLLEDES